MFIHMTNGSKRLHKAAQTLSMLSASGMRETGISCFRILKTLILRIARSTWILTLAIWDVSLTSFAHICIAAAELGGIAKFAEIASKSSLILNPLSAMTMSYLSMLSKKPLSLTICILEALPPYTGEIHDTAPLGVIATRNLRV